MLNSSDMTCYEYTRNDLIDLISQGDNKILDIGCGAGNTGARLKEMGKAKEVIGVELLEYAAKKAESKIDKVIIGNIEEIELPYDGYFDYIICGDVLEHLIDPWSTLKKVKHYLAPQGYLIASIPNIRQWRVIGSLLLHGRWTYTDTGILAKGHLRFFTRTEIIKAFSEAGFTVELISCSNSFVGIRSKFIKLVTFGIFKDFFIYQFVIKAGNYSNSKMNGNSFD